jgi:hypothetical protein
MRVSTHFKNRVFLLYAPHQVLIYLCINQKPFCKLSPDTYLQSGFPSRLHCQCAPRYSGTGYGKAAEDTCDADKYRPARTVLRLVYHLALNPTS